MLQYTSRTVSSLKLHRTFRERRHVAFPENNIPRTTPLVEHIALKKRKEEVSVLLYSSTYKPWVDYLVRGTNTWCTPNTATGYASGVKLAGVRAQQNRPFADQSLRGELAESKAKGYASNQTHPGRSVLCKRGTRDLEGTRVRFGLHEVLVPIIVMLSSVIEQGESSIHQNL